MPGGNQFRERYKKRFGADVQLYAPYSYDAAMSLIEAMKAANSTEPSKYVQALRKLNYKGVTGVVRFDAKGDIRDGGVTLYAWRDGKWVAQ